MANQEPTKKIPLELYQKLEQFANNERSADEIFQELNRFFEIRRQKDLEHNLYTVSKNGKTEEIREAARNAYLDEKGIPNKFRW